MKKTFKVSAATALAISALTPVAAFAAETPVAADGFYTTSSFTTGKDFRALSTAEKRAILTNSETVLVVGGKVYFAKDAITATTNADLAKIATTVADFEATHGKLTGNGYGNVVVSDLKVESVSAINPTEIQVTFNQDVDADSALDLSHYVLSIDDNEYNTAAQIATLLEPTSVDGTVLEYSEFDFATNTVTFKLSETNALKNAQKYSIDVKDGVLSADKTKQVAKYQDTVKTFTDTKAPVLESVLKSGDDLVLVFDEPVKSIGTVKIDDITVDGAKTYSKFTGLYTVKITGALAQDERFTTLGSHRVVAYDVKDYATNGDVPNNEAVVSSSYSISLDTTPPTVKEIKQLSTDARVFDIVFSEAVESVTASELELDIKKGNHTFTQVADSSVANPSAIADVYSVVKLGGNKYRVTFSNYTNEENINPLYAKNETAVSLAVVVKGYKDLANNVGQEYKGSVNLSKDLNAPTIKPGLDNKIDTNKLVVVFDRAITPVGELDASKITVTDKDGIKRTVSGATIANGNTIEITLDEFVSEADYNEKAPFTVTVAAGTVQSSEKVKNNTTSVTIKETTVDTAVTALATNSATVTPDKNVNGVNVNEIVIDYGAEMGASALELSNYTLDNQTLPTGTKIAINKANDKVTITLPEGFAAVDNQQLLTISKNVKTKTGSVIVNDVTEKKAYTQLIDLVDNTQPVLNKAEYLVTDLDDSTETSRIKLTFSEKVAFTANDLDDLTVVVGGATKAYTSLEAGSKENEVIVNLAQPLSLVNATTVNVVAQGEENTALNIKDLAGNIAKANSVQVSGKAIDTKLIGDAASVLATAKTNAKAALDSYKNAADYTTNAAGLTAAIEAGKTAIDAATTTEDVTAAQNAAKIAIDAIKSDAQLAAEEDLQEATDAVALAEGSKSQDDVDAAQALVTALPAGDAKDALQARIDAIEIA
ncbi:hypothetical protein HNO89_000454 [Sporosarcina luteola]|nr:hypothetical protein [Sporosarcina luteola]